MAEVVKIPVDIFENEIFDNLEDEIIILYLHILCESYKGNKKGIIRIANINITDEVLFSIFRIENIGEKIAILEKNGFVIRKEKELQVVKFWQSNRDRNNNDYKNWRKSVFLRDGFRCKSCGTNKNLQAHHIQSWKNNVERRYDTTNGVTLCRKCHLKAHGGRWNNG